MAGLFVFSPAMAQAAPFSAQALEKLEQRLFSRAYDHDPDEKRIERIELLVFGATQPGTIPERWNRLHQAIADKQRPEAAPDQGPKASQPPAKGNYPAIDTIEWRVLKKTYRDESINARLSRLENKLFGQTSPGMPYADRVERLKKIAGVGVLSAKPTPPDALERPRILGPLPKAMPRGVPEFGFSPFSYDPFEGSNSEFTDMNRMMAQMFERMNKQLRELRKLPPGTYQYRFGPEELPNFTTPPGEPQAPFSPFAKPKKQADEIPPYADPNSI
ncbi:MAG TPA: hypothetical protein V6D17_08420 [Candidatus Obscuribacterales bacterium]